MLLERLYIVAYFSLTLVAQKTVRTFLSGTELNLRKWYCSWYSNNERDMKHWFVQNEGILYCRKIEAIVSCIKISTYYCQCAYKIEFHLLYHSRGHYTNSMLNNILIIVLLWPFIHCNSFYSWLVGWTHVSCNFFIWMFCTKYSRMFCIRF